ncbi:hypothetical protein JMJ55_01080 [Belnapia sp. T6]|uniref:Uncharacterized protein n=1 Tax=Belnapia mucosa TaxID=2804532 RepID=A0ABS1UWP6_9PROT|nr:hypothetical protein [Belnapia mucosa]MBL6453894.1 hypothetical protein [Belnapia mucosa]
MMARPDSRGAGRALDALNFCLADVRDGLGPYLAIYLLAVHHWDQASIGIALSASAIAGLFGALFPIVTADFSLAAIAAVGTLLFWWMMPETSPAR